MKYPSDTLLYTFITLAFGAIASLALREFDSFIVLTTLADALGIYMAVKNFKS